MAITLQESLRGLFYAPFYVALARDAYAAEGVAVRFASSPRPGDAARNVMDGTVDVCWGGPMRVMQAYQEKPSCDLVSFAEVVTRDPFLLVGREPRPNFALTDLASARIATVSEVPTPWLCLQHDLRLVGIDPASLDRIADRGMADNMAALRAGTVDVVQLFQPLAEELLADGSGHLWYAAASRGPCSYTTFYARRGVLEAKRDEMRLLVRGLYRTQKWLHAQPAEALAEVVQSYFPDVKQPLLVAALARYKALGIWGKTPILPRDGYERLKDGLVSGGFCQGVDYAIAVDNSLADAAVAEDPPALS
jgi:NitT/TauT family transport system substrate-binding protein